MSYQLDFQKFKKGRPGKKPQDTQDLSQWDKLKMGDHVSCVTLSGKGEATERRRGTVVYIHPKLRYYGVLYECLHGAYWECYKWGTTE